VISIIEQHMVQVSEVEVVSQIIESVMSEVSVSVNV
jgi:hypothetical protein